MHCDNWKRATAIVKVRYDSLGEFIASLERCGELVRVTQPVATSLEMTEIQTRLLAERGPAVLFEAPVLPDGRVSPMPVLGNLFGSLERVRLGLCAEGESLHALGAALADLAQPRPINGMREAMDKWPLLKRVLAMGPAIVRRAPVHERVLRNGDVDLGALPVMQCWPDEPAPLITWPLVITRPPDSVRTADYNVGVYRMQVTGRDTALVRWLAHRGGARHHAQWQCLGRDMPIAIAIGADPGTVLAAVTPVPESMSEYHYAGLLRRRRLSLVPAKTVPLLVPAQAEIVLEGWVSARETAPEGPFGDHTGYYNSIEPFPVVQLSALTMRRNPVYHSTFTGRPPDEPSVIGEALNDVCLPLLQRQFPEVRDFWLPPEACSYRVGVVAIDKKYPGHAKRILMGIWSWLPQFMYTKLLIVVDSDIDARSWADVIWALSTRMDAGRDLVVMDRTPIDYLDFASPASGLGGKLGIDATVKIGVETQREWGRPLSMDEAVVHKIDAHWQALGLPGSGRAIWRARERVNGTVNGTGRA
jgi:4-hydroxy-3-polyprenylbenzoate decarboxylase